MFLMSFDCFSLCQFVHAKHVLPDQLLLLLSLSELLQTVHAKHVLLDQLLLFLPLSISLKRVHAKHVFSPPCNNWYQIQSRIACIW